MNTWCFALLFCVAVNITGSRVASNINSKCTGAVLIYLNHVQRPVLHFNRRRVFQYRL